MIFDSIENLERYSGAIPYLCAVKAFLEKHDPKTLEPGRYELVEGAYVNVSKYDVPEENKIFEAHRIFADLQYVVEGDEVMRRALLENCSDGNEYDRSGDYILYKAAKNPAELHLHAGEFLYFDTQDAHAPGIRGESTTVKKLIFKLPVKH